MNDEPEVPFWAPFVPPRKGRAIDLTGRRFGRLVVLGVDPDRRGCGPYRWWCRCDCGQPASVDGAKLRSGHTSSCGCLHRERTGDTHRKHGHSQRSPEYNIWNHMRQRCQNTSNPSYDRYGGRGITVSERWGSFENFYADMGPRPSPEHSIDRIDNDGPYSPENCRWATQGEQNRNRRDNVWLTYQGRTMVVADWAAIVGMPPQMLHSRVRAGWPTERLLTEPPTPRKRSHHG